MRRLLALAVTLWAGCTPIPVKGNGTAVAPPSSTHACAVDAQCPGGSCRLGECSPFPPDPPACSFDSECPGGTCSFGRCSP